MSRKFTRSVVSNKLDLLAELRLDLHDVVPDPIFAIRLGLGTEALHTAASFMLRVTGLTTVCDREPVSPNRFNATHDYGKLFTPPMIGKAG